RQPAKEGKGNETPMTTPTRERSTRFSTLFSTLVGLASLAILLQAGWAGIFIRQGGAYDGFWVPVPARRAEVAIALAPSAAVVAFLRLGERRDLVVGSATLVVLLALEAFIG